ncbi:MAG: 5'-methylthioadenosine/adenosylhomocysteine nucleosidase [Lachnospirales bacterium]
MYKKIGIIGAMDIEVEKLLSLLENKKMKKYGLTTFYYGSLKNKEVVICKCGIGKVNSTIATQMLIDNFQVDTILNTGVAGAIENKLNICDLVISSDLVQHDFDTSVTGDVRGVVCGFDVDSFSADKYLIETLDKACKKILTNHKHYIGRIATGDQFICDATIKNDIKDFTSAYCVEMEGGAIAQTCYVNQIPFVVLRSISDKADDSASMSFSDFVKEAAEVSANCVFAFLELL